MCYVNLRGRLHLTRISRMAILRMASWNSIREAPGRRPSDTRPQCWYLTKADVKHTEGNLGITRILIIHQYPRFLAIWDLCFEPETVVLSGKRSNLRQAAAIAFSLLVLGAVVFLFSDPCRSPMKLFSSSNLERLGIWKRRGSTVFPFERPMAEVLNKKLANWQPTSHFLSLWWPGPFVQID